VPIESVSFGCSTCWVRPHGCKAHDRKRDTRAAEPSVSSQSSADLSLRLAQHGHHIGARSLRCSYPSPTRRAGRQT